MRTLLAALLLITSPCFGQGEYSKFTSTIHQFYSGSTKQVENTWAILLAEKNIPFVVSDSVAFFYRGEATSVQWMGDFNGWGYYKEVPNQGKRISNTDIWILKMSFPKDARLDYKIVVDETKWILDPINVNQQWSGVGGGSANSELRMPNWAEEAISTPIPNVQEGKLISDILLQSKILEYQITYSVYVPFNYHASNSYPILYVTDGYEYLHPKMGNMATILNNLIYLKKIEPVIVVFVDQRDPINRANNRRMKELAMNKNYLDFYLDELLPDVESHYSILQDSTHRGILGTSMGGLNAAYFSFTRPDIFGLSAIQSPAFSNRNEIYTVCNNPDNPPVKVFLSVGTIYDAAEGARKLKGILEQNMCTYQFVETNQSHSWGQWKSLIDDILIYFFPYK